MTYPRKNLVVLLYAENVCYTTVVLPDDPLVQKARTTINASKGTFTAPDPQKLGLGIMRTYKIGETRHSQWGAREGTIGVYDRTNLTQLNWMISVARSATESPSSSED